MPSFLCRNAHKYCSTLVQLQRRLCVRVELIASAVNMRVDALLEGSKGAASRVWFSTATSQVGRWVNRVNRTHPVEKAISKARALAQKDETALAHDGRHAPLIAQRITSVPQVQPPQELFNSSMKAVRRVKPRSDLKNENEVAKNLVCCHRTRACCYLPQTVCYAWMLPGSAMIRALPVCRLPGRWTL